MSKSFIFYNSWIKEKFIKLIKKRSFILYCFPISIILLIICMDYKYEIKRNNKIKDIEYMLNEMEFPSEKLIDYQKGGK